MKNESWEIIIDHYKKARMYFWGSKELKNWRRDDENGYYHLWAAYHLAQKSREQEHLWYARILYMMMCLTDCIFNNYTVLRRFAKPMMDEFELAAKSGTPPTEKELKAAKLRYEWLLYDDKCHSEEENRYEKSVKLIENHEILDKFYFHDSKPVLFTLNEENSAILKLSCDESIATFEFTDILDVHIDGDPRCSYIDDFFCYPCGSDPCCEYLTFDIEYYKITCKHIRAISVECNSEP